MTASRNIRGSNARGLLGAAVLIALGASLVGCADRKTLKEADVLVEHGHYPEALDLLDNQLRQSPKDKTLWRAEIRLMLRVERPDLAEVLYTKFTREVSPNDAVLLDALRDKNESIRMMAAKVLAVAGDAAAVAPLAAILGDPNDNVRREVVVALGDLHDPRAVPPLIKALGDRWWNVRSQAALALDKQRDPRAIVPLFAALKDPDSTVSSAAEGALTTLIRQPGADPQIFLKALQGGDPAEVRAAALALAVVQNKAATPVLVGFLASADPALRQLGLRALRYAHDPEALPAIRKALGDPMLKVRVEAIVALVDYRDKESAAPIGAIGANGQEDPQLRAFANEAAARLKALP